MSPCTIEAIASSKWFDFPESRSSASLPLDVPSWTMVDCIEKGSVQSRMFRGYTTAGRAGILGLRQG
jgi:hypothetical protein